MLLLCAFYGFCACPACVGSYLIDSGGRFLDLLAGGRPPGETAQQTLEKPNAIN